MKLLIAFVFVLCSTASFAEDAAESSVRSYYGHDYKKCHVKYQVCCEKSYECGYDTQKYLISKTCHKDECYDKKEPKTHKKCETKYGYKKVCSEKKDYHDDYKHDKKKYGYRASVRTGYYGHGHGYKKTECHDEKYPYQHCYDYTYYENKKVCHKKEYDCSYYGEKHVPKYCKKYECGDVKYKSADGYH